MKFKAVFAGLTAAGLVACGSREPATDAERLARGRELVQQMSDRLASAAKASVTTTEVREVVRVSGAPGAAGASDQQQGLTMHYFDSRGVSRVYEVSIDDAAWRIWRDAPGFSQRFSGTLADGGNTIAGVWQLCRDDVNWHDDLAITYRRRV